MAEETAQAVARFRCQNGLATDEATRTVWLATLGYLIVPLPNFSWRREAIDRHDAHHVLTGYPVTVKGELCVAAWELGVRCYASLGARLLCAGLMMIGMLIDTRGTLNAYRRGRDQAEHYLRLAGPKGSDQNIAQASRQRLCGMRR